MNDPKRRSIRAYKSYFSDFLLKQRPQVTEKLLRTLRILEIAHPIPSNYFKHLEGTDGLFEIGIQHRTDIFRIFCFFGKDKELILANAFQKKTQKTPSSELKKATRIKKDYEAEQKFDNT